MYYLNVTETELNILRIRTGKHRKHRKLTSGSRPMKQEFRNSSLISIKSFSLL